MNADQLVQSIQQRGMIPTSQNTWTSANLLTFADEEMRVGIANFMRSMQENYSLFNQDTSFTSGTTAYLTPYRAVGGLRAVQRIDANGNVLETLSQVPLEDILNQTSGFYMDGPNIVLVSDPGATTNKLRQKYYMRPSALVLAAATATVSAINTGTKTVTTSATIPSTFTTSVTYDFVRGKSPHDIFGIDFAASVASGTTLTFTTTLPTGLAVGDIVCLAEQTSIPNCPPEVHPLLAEMVHLRYMLSGNDLEKTEACRGEITKMTERVKGLLSNRDEASPQTIIARNPLFFPTRW